MRTIKFWEIKAQKNKDSVDMLIYGSIVGGEKYEETDVTITDFIRDLESLPSNTKELNMRINSPGGSVFTSVSMMNQLKRLKSEKKITVNAYIDGIGASSASMLPMVADNIYMYENSFLMIHKPMASAFMANSLEMKETAELLDQVEARTLIPAYKSKGTSELTDEKISELLNGKDNWLNAEEVSKFFNVTIIEEGLQMVAHKDFDAIAKSESTPKEVKALLEVDKEPQANVLTDAERQEILSNSKANIAYLQTLNLL